MNKGMKYLVVLSAVSFLSSCNSKYDEGYDAGLLAGYGETYDGAYDDGYADGSGDATTDATNDGYADGYADGYDRGEGESYDLFASSEYRNGFETGTSLSKASAVIFFSSLRRLGTSTIGASSI